MGSLGEARALFFSSCRTFRLALLCGINTVQVRQMRDDAERYYRHLLSTSGLDSEQLFEMYAEIDEEIVDTL